MQPHIWQCVWVGGEVVTDIQCIRDAAQSYSAPPPTKNYLSPNGNSAEGENPKLTYAYI